MLIPNRYVPIPEGLSLYTTGVALGLQSKANGHWSARLSTPENICVRCGHDRNTHLDQPEVKGGPPSSDRGWCVKPEGTCLYNGGACGCTSFVEPDERLIRETLQQLGSTMTAKIRIEDKLTPEDNAMVQALYSRSAESVDVHLAKVATAGSGKFMQNYYVGYNHKSIADCGTTTMYFEGVSMLAAKAIEDWPLYCGQETSSRYVDMGRQSIVDPIGTPESHAVLDRWMAFYVGSQDRVAEYVRSQFPRGVDEDEKIYANAVKARTFDILRGFLPAGITTQCSWHTNLRQASDHLALLIHHPCVEIREIACRTRQELALKYPSSGFTQTNAGVSAIKSDAAQDAWAERCSAFTYHDEQIDDGYAAFDIPRGAFNPYLDLLESRPRGGVLPHFLTELGLCTFNYYLDFGSFRDLQRHRNGVCLMPLLTTKYGFESWYIAQLPAIAAAEARELIAEQTEAIRQLDGTDVEKQYYVAMGFNVPCSVTYGAPAAIYVMELRSSKTVHPTLRDVVLEHMVKPFRSEFPEVRLHVDESPSDWDIRRGKHTITERAP